MAKYLLFGIILVISNNVFASNECSSKGTSILVLLVQGKLLLCKNGKNIDTYSVAIGSKGYGKKEEGDNKTPVGLYPLESPRKSKSGYHKIIPIGYPTEKQKAEGYTGSAVGIHGPKKGFRWLGGLNAMVNWTQGCVAVSTTNKIDEISSWVESEKVKIVELQ
ncbi:MAG: L,D-transpeptidase family protein [Maribacter sp.]|nr:L,D-transpeptidase family protein [Maribacter sp.]